MLSKNFIRWGQNQAKDANLNREKGKENVSEKDDTKNFIT